MNILFLTMSSGLRNIEVSGIYSDLIRKFRNEGMVVTFVLDIISGLFSISILRWILQFYTVFVVYEGAHSLMGVKDRDLTRYSLIASLIIIVSPSLIAIVFDKLSLILN